MYLIEIQVIDGLCRGWEPVGALVYESDLRSPYGHQTILYHIDKQSNVIPESESEINEGIEVCGE